MAVDLRPLTLGELLDRSFSLYRTHLPTFVALMLPVAAVNAVVSTLAQVIRSAAAAPRASPSPELIATLVGAMGLLMVLVVALIFVQVISFAMVSAAASSAYLGEPASARDAFAAVRPAVGSVSWLAVLVLVRVFGAFMVGAMCVLAVSVLATAAGPRLGAAGVALGTAAALGVLVLTALAVAFLMLRYSLAVAAWVNEALTASDALGRSVELLRGQLPRALVIMVFGVIISQVAGLILQGPFVIAGVVAGPDTPLGFGLTIAGALAASMASAVALPLTTVAFAVLYFDARVRHEAFDLELLIDAIDPDARAGAAAPTMVLG
jgi:hypothetical protein